MSKLSKKLALFGRIVVRSAASLAVAGWLITTSTGNSFAQGEPACKPAVSVETEACDVSGHIQTFARVTNRCPCDVDVTVNLPNGGGSVFSNVKKNGGSQREMIMPCGDKKVNLGDYSYKFSCPTGGTHDNVPKTAAPTRSRQKDSTTDSPSASQSELAKAKEAAKKKAENADQANEAAKRQLPGLARDYEAEKAKWRAAEDAAAAARARQKQIDEANARRDAELAKQNRCWNSGQSNGRNLICCGSQQRCETICNQRHPGGWKCDTACAGQIRDVVGRPQGCYWD
jgi:hypothetical protein